MELIVTSPPYPMIAMWDASFRTQDPAVAEALDRGDGGAAFDLMHRILDRTWAECYRVLRPGGFACINIGDATRTVAGGFQLYTNHSRITTACEALGFQSLPAVIWRKQTNAPNKFMGSGMLPAGAYVTLEHEYILILRKGGKRTFSGDDERRRRRRSALFWEERNRWFSDLWDFKGVQQRAQSAAPRERTGAFPLELPRRLIQMYSLREDTVLDPFVGTGTTMLAAVGAGRNSLGVEYDRDYAPVIDGVLTGNRRVLAAARAARFADHLSFLETYRAGKGDGYRFKHHNAPHDMPVITGQETDLWIPALSELSRVDPGSGVVAGTDVRPGTDVLPDREYIAEYHHNPDVATEAARIQPSASANDDDDENGGLQLGLGL